MCWLLWICQFKCWEYRAVFSICDFVLSFWFQCVCINVHLTIFWFVFCHTWLNTLSGLIVTLQVLCKIHVYSHQRQLWILFGHLSCVKVFKWLFAACCVPNQRVCCVCGNKLLRNCFIYTIIFVSLLSVSFLSMINMKFIPLIMPVIHLVNSQGNINILLWMSYVCLIPRDYKKPSQCRRSWLRPFWRNLNVVQSQSLVIQAQRKMKGPQWRPNRMAKVKKYIKRYFN